MNRNRIQRNVWVIPLVGFLVLAALPAQAQLVGDQEVATMSINGGSVSFAPKISFEAMSLTVSGQGYVSTRTFRSGQTASFAPVDSEGFQLPDGTYSWGLVVSPRPQDLNTTAFKNGTISADGRNFEAAEAPQGQRQSGVFTIKNGVMVDPNVVEAEPSRALGAASAVAAPSAAARAAEHSDRRDGN